MFVKSSVAVCIIVKQIMFEQHASHFHFRHKCLDREKTKHKLYFLSEICLYECSKKSDWKKHISTTKHKNATQLLQNATSDATNVATPYINVKPVYNCDCGKKFSHSSSYYRHRSNCFQYQIKLSSLATKTATTHVEA